MRHRFCSGRFAGCTSFPGYSHDAGETIRVIVMTQADAVVGETSRSRNVPKFPRKKTRHRRISIVCFVVVTVCDIALVPY